MVLAALAAVAVPAACSSHGSNAAPTTTVAKPAEKSSPSFAVGLLRETFVDSSRPTAVNGDAGARPDRTLATLVFYPARGAPSAGGDAVSGAPADTADGPYPLIVFAHGLGGSPEGYQPVLQRWAAAGFVVAAPAFPLTNSAARGGPNAQDYTNQPADVSFVIDEVLHAAAQPSGVLAGLVDPDAIGAAGHSLGGITTIGLATNTCCHDARVKAAVVMAGDALTFPDGSPDFAAAPPLLFVHGTADTLVPYEASVDAFNAAQGPKGLLTIPAGDHGSPVALAGKAFTSVMRATTDFFRAYLEHDDTAEARIAKDATAGAATIVFDATAGSKTTIPTSPTSAPRSLQATATPHDGLVDGQSVTVTWSGYTPGKTVNVVQCSERVGTDATACDLKHGAILHPDPTGSGSVAITVVTGAVGTGVCDAAHSQCVIVVNDGGSLEPTASVRVPISFASA